MICLEHATSVQWEDVFLATRINEKSQVTNLGCLGGIMFCIHLGFTISINIVFMYTNLTGIIGFQGQRNIFKAIKDQVLV